ncbi:MAG: dihydroneopterin aldolase [Candidatus Omnitrophica bacterium]|nr:dihydroneopterin aldolase [Candidatus Omnitrophota bacterium]
MPDHLILRDIAVEARVGVYDVEWKKLQTIWIDVELSIDAAGAAAEDDVRAAVDYAKLITSVRDLAQTRAYRLMETLAEAIAQAIVAEYPRGWVRVRVKKRALPGIDYAAVEVERIAPRARRRPAPARRTRRRRSAAGGR